MSVHDLLSSRIKVHFWSRMDDNRSWFQTKPADWGFHAMWWGVVSSLEYCIPSHFLSFSVHVSLSKQYLSDDLNFLSHISCLMPYLPFKLNACQDNSSSWHVLNYIPSSRPLHLCPRFLLDIVPQPKSNQKTLGCRPGLTRPLVCNLVSGPTRTQNAGSIP